MTDGIKIDIGCGGAKREGFIGIDSVPGDQVDYVLDVTVDRLPFEDASVSHVYSAHFFEHIAVPNHVLSEIGRVCVDGATIEVILPYAFSSGAFVYGHVTFMTELPWMHFCITHRDVFLEVLGGRWQLEAINYVIPERVIADMQKRDVPIDFAVKYFKGVVEEFILEMRFFRDPETPIVLPVRSFSTTRRGERTDLQMNDPA